MARSSHQVALWAPGLGGLESEASALPSGLGIPQLLEAVLKLLPLDTYVESPVRAPFPDLRGHTCLWGVGGKMCPQRVLTLIRRALTITQQGGPGGTREQTGPSVPGCCHGAGIQ